MSSIPRTHEQCRPGDGSPTPKVSVVILTLNEEINIAECIESCSWSDDVHVLDSGSTDRTHAITTELNAKVHTNHFESFGKQRNWAIDNIPLKHDWVFHLDADERFTPALIRELDSLIKQEPTDAGFFVPHKLMLMDRWLRRSGGYPTYQMRLFHKERMRFIDHGQGQREEENKAIGTLKQPYLHFLFSKGLYDWIEKHNRYSSLEAIQAIQDAGQPLRLAQLFKGPPVERRREWKQLVNKLPARPFLRWFVSMFVQGGVLEGKAGRTYAALLAHYERMTVLKLRMLRQSQKNNTGAFEADTTPPPAGTTFDPGDQTLMRQPETKRKRTAPPTAPKGEEGQLLPEASPWTFKEKVIRAIWMLIGQPIFRITFHNWYGIRNQLLRLFGAKIGKDVHIRPTVKVEIPWNLDIHDGVTVGDNAILYSLGTITIGERCIISQYAHLCAGTHDHTDRSFPLIRDPVEIGADAWIGADAYVGPNVTVGRLSVLGARSSAYKDLKPEQVYVGNPARAIKSRELVDAP